MYVFGGSYRAVSLAITPGGVPIVAWPTASYVTTVAEFVSGTTWTKLGTAPTADSGSGAVNGPLVSVNGAGQIFLASIARSSGLFRVSVAQFDGTAWQPLGSPLVSAGEAEDYDMTVDGSGAPVVADSEYVTADTGDRLFTYRWDGATWEAPRPAWPGRRRPKPTSTAPGSPSTAADVCWRPGCF